MKVCGPQGWEFDLQWRPKGGEIDIWKPENVKFPVGCPASPSWGKPLIGALSWTLRKFVQTKLPRKMKIKQDLKHWAMQGNKPCFWILLDYYTSLHEGCDPANCQRKLAKFERQFISHSLVKNYRFGYDKFVLFKTILNFSMIIANSGEKTWITEYWAPE